MSKPKITRVEGTKNTFRRKDGQPQRYVNEKIAVGYFATKDPVQLADQLRDFAAGKEDCDVSIEHESYRSGDYDCDVVLELSGWEDCTEDDVKRDQKRLRDERRTNEAVRIAQLEQELRRLKGTP